MRRMSLPLRRDLESSARPEPLAPLQWSGERRVTRRPSCLKPIDESFHVDDMKTLEGEKEDTPNIKTVQINATKLYLREQRLFRVHSTLSDPAYDGGNVTKRTPMVRRNTVCLSGMERASTERRRSIGSALEEPLSLSSCSERPDRPDRRLSFSASTFQDDITKLRAMITPTKLSSFDEDDEKDNDDDDGDNDEDDDSAIIERLFGGVSEDSKDEHDDEATTKHKNRVRFGQVIINEHPMIVGVNPGGTKGPPITIGWTAVTSATVNLDDYETMREGHRRFQHQMLMPKGEREFILRKRLGFSQAELNQATKAANIVRAQRRATIGSLDAHRAHARMEYCKRNLRHALTLGMRKRAERRYISRCLSHDQRTHPKPGFKPPNSNKVAPDPSNRKNRVVTTCTAADGRNTESTVGFDEETS